MMQTENLFQEEIQQEYALYDKSNKKTLLYYFSSCGIIGSLLYAIYYIVNSHIYSSIISFSISMVFAGILGLHYYIKKIPQTILINTFIAFCSLISLFIYITGGPTGFDSLLVLIFPIISISMFGLKKGTIVSVAMFFLMLLSLIILPIPYIKGVYSIDFNVVYFTIYIGILIFCFIYELIRKETRFKILKDKIELFYSEQNNKAKSEFIMDLSYKIRTPLSSIMGLSNIMKNDTSLNSEQKELIESIHSSSQNLATVLNSIVKLAETHTDEELTNLLRFNLKEAIETAILDFNKRMGNMCSVSNITTISTEIPQDISGNPHKIKKIIQLLFNAIYTHTKKQNIKTDIRVQCQKESQQSIVLKIDILSPIKTNQ
ncbi:MAG: histidine kinase dimerization/phospho-acceptor domain-containing protein, partial [Endomicrobiia bacterium]